MPRPTREEEERVNREIKNTRKRLLSQMLFGYKNVFAIAPKPSITEATAWRPKYTDPKRAYRNSNADHWAKKRVDASVIAARNHLREQSAKEGTSDSLTAREKSACGSELIVQPFIWSADKITCMHGRSFPDMVIASLMPDLPGNLSLERSKRNSEMVKNLPKNIYHQKALDPANNIYWITNFQDKTRRLSKGKNRNDLPI